MKQKRKEERKNNNTVSIHRIVGICEGEGKLRGVHKRARTYRECTATTFPKVIAFSSLEEPAIFLQDEFEFCQV